MNTKAGKRDVVIQGWEGWMYVKAENGIERLVIEFPFGTVEEVSIQNILTKIGGSEREVIKDDDR